MWAPGGVIRNEFVHRSGAPYGGAGISVSDSPVKRVVHLDLRGVFQ
jgi:hypothetical protein